MSRSVINTPAAPQAIGTYSQAVLVGDTLYLSGQIALIPETMELADGIEAQIDQSFRNLLAVVSAAGMTASDIVKLNIYLTDLANFSKVNDAMKDVFSEPFPARAAIGVASLPRGALVEVEAIAVKA